MPRGHLRQLRRVRCQQRSGTAHAEPVRIQPRRGHVAQRNIQAFQLAGRHAPVRLVGGKQVGHDAVQPQRRCGRESRQQRAQQLGNSALAAHASVDLKMHGNGPASSGSGMACLLQLVQLRQLPHHRGHVVRHCCCALAGKDAADRKDAGLRAERTRRHAFLDAGHAQPAGPGADHSRRADCQRVAVCLGLHNGHQIGMWSGKRGQQTEVLFKGVS